MLTSPLQSWCSNTFGGKCKTLPVCLYVVHISVHFCLWDLSVNRCRLLKVALRGCFEVQCCMYDISHKGRGEGHLDQAAPKEKKKWMRCRLHRRHRVRHSEREVCGELAERIERAGCGEPAVRGQDEVRGRGVRQTDIVICRIIPSKAGHGFSWCSYKAKQSIPWNGLKWVTRLLCIYAHVGGGIEKDLETSRVHTPRPVGSGYLMLSACKSPSLVEC